MSRVIVLGAGVAGHTAALTLRRKLGNQHEVIVVSPNSQWNWIPSNIWVGVGRMTREAVVFPLAPVYKRKRITFHQAKATAIWPNGDAGSPQGAVDIEYTEPGRDGQTERVRYDFLINATGPALDFAATPGLGPDAGYTASVCTPGHAVDAAARLDAAIERARTGEKLRLVVGVGHGRCTCEGAAFEYAFNVEQKLEQEGVRDNTEVVYLSNEPELGDFGVGGMSFRTKHGDVSGEQWMSSLFRERGIRAITRAAVTAVEPQTIRYVQEDGSPQSLPFDFAMLLPPFRGVALRAYDRDGADISQRFFAPSGFMKVDADYSPKPYSQWSAKDWPSTYQVPGYPNMFAVGIAFAPPHAISEPRSTPDGVAIAPAPPRTGMPSGAMGKAAALNIAEMIRTGTSVAQHSASMADLPAACIASTGTGFARGSAVAMTMAPIVPDFQARPLTHGRDADHTTGEVGLAAHWLKRMLHTAFLYKAKAYPLWYLIPE
ncbi:NAD(P)/FAD-dependent oxidoreductase [Microbacterium schleiferi]|uniref:NAD(P)/FAD-dependent oxidoreductase n=1 Tax=Microbacterium schleiferi TaxID=69362 RepID=UPI00311EAE46